MHGQKDLLAFHNGSHEVSGLFFLHDSKRESNGEGEILLSLYEELDVCPRCEMPFQNCECDSLEDVFEDFIVDEDADNP